MVDSMSDQVTISVVSHGQRMLVGSLLNDLAHFPQVANVILTHNLPEPDELYPKSLEGRMIVLRNDRPHGFGANHNTAFQYCDTPFFCILNPDIRLPENPFPALLACFADSQIAIAAPIVLNPHGCVEDSARHFPTPWGLVQKALGITDGRYAYRYGDPPLRPDWMAGMFLLVRTDVFRNLGGFDVGFHLYYEDVDLCARLKKPGMSYFCRHLPL